MIDRRYVERLLELVAVVVVMLLVVPMWRQGQRSERGSIWEDGPVIKLTDLRRRVGDADTVLIEFGDFQCVFCGRQAIEIHPTIQREFIEGDVLSYAYVHFPLEELHPRAVAGSEAAECGGQQGNYWGMHVRLFGDPRNLTEGGFLDHARRLGLDLERFAACLDGSTAEVVMADRRLGMRLGVRGLPTFYLGRVEASGKVMLTAPFYGTARAQMLKERIARLEEAEWWSR